MQLTFRGKSYDASFPTVEAIATSESATFLGKLYARKQFQVQQRHQPADELTYRGVRYTH